MSQDKGGISTKRAAALLDLHYSTAWFMMHKLREAMAVRQNGHLLSGLVEIDEAHLGGKAKGKRAGGTNKKQVCVVVERLNRQAGDAVLIVLPDRSGEALKTAVASVLEPMTHIRTDGLPKNSVLHGLAAKLNMDTIGKNYDEQGALENVDRVISLLRRFLMGTYHQYCSRAHLQRFLNEFAFRFNRRYKWSELFDRTLSAAALCPPVQYAAIS
jgi:transposase-like protein